MIPNISESKISDQELRLKCLELVVNEHGARNPVLAIVLSVTFLNWVKNGELSISPTNKVSQLKLHDVAYKIINELIEEVENPSQARNGSDTDPDDLEKPKSFFSRIVSFFRGE